MDLPDLKLLGAIILTSIAKYFMTEEAPPADETAQDRRRRVRRGIGGILAGIIAAYFGNDTVIRWVEVLTEEDRILVAIVLALTGEHVMRWLMALGPDAFSKMAKRFLGNGQ